MADRIRKPPEAAIPPEEDAVSIDAAIATRATLAQNSFAVRTLFDALVELVGRGDLLSGSLPQY